MRIEIIVKEDDGTIVQRFELALQSTTDLDKSNGTKLVPLYEPPKADLSFRPNFGRNFGH